MVCIQGRCRHVVPRTGNTGIEQLNHEPVADGWWNRRLPYLGTHMCSCSREAHGGPRQRQRHSLRPCPPARALDRLRRAFRLVKKIRCGLRRAETRESIAPGDIPLIRKCPSASVNSSFGPGGPP